MPAAATTRTSRTHRPRVLVDSYNPAKDDVAGYDDPVVREIALEALGHEKGSVVAVDPTSGRILAIVNQKMAFSSALEPCSTIKPFIALGGLQEGVITRDTMIRVAPRHYMDLTEAMAHSNNNFFQEVGTRLGFDRVIKYDFSVGARPTRRLQHSGRAAGFLADPSAYFRRGRSHVELRLGIRMTPFQLASLVSTLANGGTQYYLQYPRSTDGPSRILNRAFVRSSISKRCFPTFATECSAR